MPIHLVAAKLRAKKTYPPYVTSVLHRPQVVYIVLAGIVGHQLVATIAVGEITQASVRPSVPGLMQPLHLVVHLSGILHLLTKCTNYP